MADNQFNVEIHKLGPSAIIELFQLAIVDGPTLYFHAGTNAVRRNIVFGGNTYVMFGLQFSGLTVSTNGAAPTPTVRVANPEGYMSILAQQYDYFTQATFTRIRTFARFLDAVNFPGGVNPDADPTKTYPPDVFRLEQMSGENKNSMEFLLNSPFDAAGTQLPRRRVVANLCAWVYRSTDCGYVGSASFDVNDQPVALQSQDKCGKRVSSCKCRWGNAPLPYGGFPASDRVAR